MGNESTREDELFDYVNIPSYLKISSKNSNEKDKNDFEISLYIVTI